MKKLMIALGLVAMAAVSAQAAKINWSVSGVTAYGGDATPQGYTMACFCAGVSYSDTTHDVYTTVAAAEAWAKSNGATTEGVHQLNTATVSKEGSAMTTSPYATMQNYWKNSTAAGTKAGDFYAVIFNAANIADATAYMVTTDFNQIFGTTATTTHGVSLSVGTWTAIASPVPEPTSGLLLLLGVAGMALRRKRA